MDFGVPLGLGPWEFDMQAHNVVLEPGNELWLLTDSGNFMVCHACEIHLPVAGDSHKMVFAVEHLMCLTMDLLAHRQDCSVQVVWAYEIPIGWLPNIVGREKACKSFSAKL